MRIRTKQKIYKFITFICILTAIYSINRIRSKRKNTIKLVAIKGERHSGTSLLRWILNKHCPQLTWKLQIEQNGVNKTIDADGKYGWKHGLIRKDLEEGDFMIFVTRDAKTWTRRMSLKTYEKRPRGRRSKSNTYMSTFLRTKWYPKMEPENQWNNVISMRNTKYRDWLDYVGLHPETSMMLRYEDFITDRSASKLVDKFIKKYNIPCDSSEVKLNNNLIKYGVDGWNECEKVLRNGTFTKICSDKFDPAKEAYDWNPEDWKFVLDNLDLNLEARLGYIYQ